jgi:hypothetical protein
MIILPIEIINIILDFLGKVKLRNGKYINQIEIDKYNIINDNIRNKIKCIPNNNIIFFETYIYFIYKTDKIQHISYEEMNDSDLKYRRYEIIRRYYYFYGDNYCIIFRKHIHYTFLYRIKQFLFYIFGLHNLYNEPNYLDYKYEYNF